MIEAFNIPGSYPGSQGIPGAAMGLGNNAIFYGPSGSGNNWFVWEKPRGCSMIYMMCYGSGGGGGGGFSAAAAAARGGGGGGASGAFSQLLVAAFFVPD